MSKATLTIRFNSSYVLIGTTSDRLGTGAARPPATRLSILKFQCTCPFLFGIPVVFITCLLFQASESMASSVGLFRCTPHFSSGYAPLYSHFMCHKWHAAQSPHKSSRTEKSTSSEMLSSCFFMPKGIKNTPFGVTACPLWNFCYYSVT